MQMKPSNAFGLVCSKKTFKSDGDTMQLWRTRDSRLKPFKCAITGHDRAGALVVEGFNYINQFSPNQWCASSLPTRAHQCDRTGDAMVMLKNARRRLDCARAVHARRPFPISARVSSIGKSQSFGFCQVDMYAIRYIGIVKLFHSSHTIACPVARRLLIKPNMLGRGQPEMCKHNTYGEIHRKIQVHSNGITHGIQQFQYVIQ